MLANALSQQNASDGALPILPNQQLSPELIQQVAVLNQLLVLQNAAGQVQKQTDSVPLNVTKEPDNDDNGGGSTSILIDLGETLDAVTPPKEKPQPKKSVKAVAETTITVMDTASQPHVAKRKTKAVRK